VFDIVHRVGIKSSLASVYQALSTVEGVASWWTDDVSGAARIGDTLTFNFRLPTGELKGSMVMAVRELQAPTRVVWECVDGPAEWIGTMISFDLVDEDAQTTVKFAHRGWREEVDFTAHCSMKWAVFLLSLRDYVQTGRGQPSPHDIKIDNWN
jgi:uncharacterized protein YndB with AHSA1/START domain